ncbi:MAG TPA: adenylate/guanylate cyclase domain-containing protein [Usitatibacteraceae bacterium]|nr:adenylate/guanylate cyclase domain-containing protein [Usitatibacteraceae bacterium]
MEKFNKFWARYFSSINALIRAGLGLGLVLLFVLAYVFEDKSQLLQRLENSAYDLRLRATMPEKMDPRIVIIDIDEKTLAAEGRWPLGRDKHAALIKNMFELYKVKVAGYDVFFSEPDTSSGLSKLEELAKTSLKDSAEYKEKLSELRQALDYDAQFADVLKKYPVVLAFAGSNERGELAKLGQGTLPDPVYTAESFKNRPIRALEIDGYSANIKLLRDAAPTTGHILPRIDFDGILRRVPSMIKYKDGYYDSLSIAVFRTYLDNAPLAVKLREDEGDRYNKLQFVQVRDRVIPVDDDACILVPFRGKSPMFRYISATDIIRGRLSPGELDGKIALIGTSAQGLFDLRATPFSEVYPGVESHANLISGYLDGTVKRLPNFDLAIKALLILVVGVPLAIALVKLSPIWSTVVVAGSAVLVSAFNLYWWNAGYVLPIALPLLLIGLLFLLNMAYGFFVEARSKRAITGIFGTYVPKELVAEMAENPDAYTTKGESRDMTVLFSDVRSFTTISEGLSPTELTALMNAYLTEMTKEIQNQRGTIDKYIGDAIMAFWGAPVADEKHAEHALLSAISMQKRLKEIGPDFVKRGWPKLEIGVGLNCGVMNVGDMGSSFRRAYTVLGDAVNLASRLEGLTKEYGVGILVSENIVNRVPIAIYREMDRVRVKGKLEPISIFEPAGLKGEVPDQTLDEIDRFHRSLERYREQRWDDAQSLLTPLAQADPKRKVYQVYLERISIMRAKPPGSNWDGVFTFTTK